MLSQSRRSKSIQSIEPLCNILIWSKPRTHFTGCWPTTVWVGHFKWTQLILIFQSFAWVPLLISELIMKYFSGEFFFSTTVTLDQDSDCLLLLMIEHQVTDNSMGLLPEFYNFMTPEHTFLVWYLNYLKPINPTTNVNRLSFPSSQYLCLLSSFCSVKTYLLIACKVVWTLYELLIWEFHSMLTIVIQIPYHRSNNILIITVNGSRQCPLSRNCQSMGERHGSVKWDWFSDIVVAWCWG